MPEALVTPPVPASALDLHRDRNDKLFMFTSCLEILLANPGITEISSPQSSCKALGDLDEMKLHSWVGSRQVLRCGGRNCLGEPKKKGGLATVGRGPTRYT